MVNQLIGIEGEMILSHSETGWGPPSLWVKPKKSHCSSAWRGAGWWFEHQNHSQINSHWRFSRHVHLRREHELNANLISFYQTQDKTTFYKLLFAELLKAQESCLKVKGKVQLTYAHKWNITAIITMFWLILTRLIETVNGITHSVLHQQKASSVWCWHHAAEIHFVPISPHNKSGMTYSDGTIL